MLRRGHARVAYTAYGRDATWLTLLRSRLKVSSGAGSVEGQRIAIPEFDVIYIIASGDFNVYAEIQQQITLELMRRLDAEGIGLAKPTQVVELKIMTN